MFKWIYRSRPNDDWVTLILIFVFFLLVFLYKKNSKKLVNFFKFWNINNYKLTLEIEKYHNPFVSFNFILLIVISTSYSLLSYFFYESTISSSIENIPFLYFPISILFVVSIRFLLMKLIFSFSGAKDIFRQAIYQSFCFHGSICIFVLLNFIIFYYGLNKAPELILFTTIIAAILMIISHAFIYLKIGLKNPEYSFYIFLYICGLKIAPWLWLYELFY